MSNQIIDLFNNANRITFLTGAGISTDSNIPDWRSQKGIWTNNAGIEEFISLYYFNKKPKDFWKVYKEVFSTKLLKKYLPNSGHNFITELQHKGKEITVITQNIDGLHSVSGTENVIEVHGTIRSATCPKCKSKYDLDFINANEVPRCIKSNKKSNICNFILKPDVVLFGDEVVQYQSALEAAYNSELFVVMGTSLEVWPINSIPEYINKTKIPSILVNLEKTKKDKYFNFIHLSSIREFVSEFE